MTSAECRCQRADTDLTDPEYVHGWSRNCPEHGLLAEWVAMVDRDQARFDESVRKLKAAFRVERVAVALAVMLGVIAAVLLVRALR